MLFSRSKQPQNSHTDGDLNRAQRLSDALQKFKRITRQSKLQKWADVFRLIREADGVEDSQVDAVLTWYIANIKDKYTPHVHSAQTFRVKLPALIKATQRAEGRLDTLPAGSQEMPPALVRMLVRLWALGWPIITKDHLTAAVVKSLANYTEWRRKAAKVLTDADLPAADRYLILCLLESLPAAAAFVEEWFCELHRSVCRWDDWTGNLTNSVVSPDHNRFRKRCQGVAAIQTGDAGRFDRVAQLIQDQSA